MAKEQKIEYIEEDSDGAVKKIERLRKILKRCKSERQEYLEGWQRARADHQNYIKKKDEEMIEFKKFASEGTIVQIIPILDNLILACEAVPESISQDNWIKGIMQIRKQFEIFLEEAGVKTIGAEPGAKFDPVYHDGAGEVEGEGESGTIAKVLQRGYTLNGKIIRAVRVQINK